MSSDKVISSPGGKTCHRVDCEHHNGKKKCTVANKGSTSITMNTPSNKKGGGKTRHHDCESNLGPLKVKP